jgi:hypothetical protein
MNYSDWLEQGGSAVIRGGAFTRPSPYVMGTKAVYGAPIAKQAARVTSTASTALARQRRRSILEIVRLIGQTHDLLLPAPPRKRARAATSSPSILEQSWPGVRGQLARARHNAVVQRWRK